MYDHDNDYKMKTLQRLYLPLKRLIGLFGSVIGILFCFSLFWWWIIPVNAIISRGHPFFVRHRIGKNGKAFRLIKFRSMRVDADPHMSAISGEAQKQVTGFGKFLRATSLDETPQLLNVFVGQMCFIGPRPLIDVNDQDVLTINLRKENGAIILTPGISGLAQIHSRAELDPIEKAQYDFEYLQRFSLWLDIKIFIYTILKLFGAAKGR